MEETSERSQIFFKSYQKIIVTSKAHSLQYISLPSGSFTDFNECYQIKF